MARFADALDRTAETIKRPPPPPLGHYVLQVTKVPSPPEEMNSAKFTGSKLTIPLAILSATDDVDEDELAEFGNISGVPLRLEFIFNEAPGEEQKFEATLNRLKEFCERCGVDVSEGTTVMQWLAELAGCQFIGQVKHKADQNDPTILYPEIGATTAV